MPCDPAWDGRPGWAYDADRGLPLVEQTLLWSMRVWVVSLDQRAEAVSRLIASAFADLGAPACAPFLDGFMWALRHGAERTIGVGCPCQAGLDVDELLLLRVFALAQHGESPVALALLREMVTQPAAWVCLESVEWIGAALARAQRWTKPRLPTR